MVDECKASGTLGVPKRFGFESCTIRANRASSLSYKSKTAILICIYQRSQNMLTEKGKCRCNKCP